MYYWFDQGSGAERAGALEIGSCASPFNLDLVIYYHYIVGAVLSPIVLLEGHLVF